MRHHCQKHMPKGPFFCSSPIFSQKQDTCRRVDLLYIVLLFTGIFTKTLFRYFHENSTRAECGRVDLFFAIHQYEDLFFCTSLIDTTEVKPAETQQGSVFLRILNRTARSKTILRPSFWDLFFNKPSPLFFGKRFFVSFSLALFACLL